MNKIFKCSFFITFSTFRSKYLEQKFPKYEHKAPGANGSFVALLAVSLRLDKCMQQQQASIDLVAYST